MFGSADNFCILFSIRYRARTCSRVSMLTFEREKIKETGSLYLIAGADLQARRSAATPQSLAGYKLKFIEVMKFKIFKFQVISK